MYVKVAAVLVAFALAGCRVDSDQRQEIDAQINSTVLSNWLVEGNARSIWRRLSEPAREDFGSFSGFSDFQRRLMEQLGNKTSTYRTNIFINAEVRYAENMASFDKLSGNTQAAFLWVLTDGSNPQVDRIEVRLVPPSASARYPGDRRSRTDFRLPFSDEMVVLWGGTDTFANYHADTNAQRYAIDFLSFEEGVYFENDGTENDDHFCWGKSVLSPGFGRVISVDTAIPDNQIPIENDNPVEYLGNHVGIDHGNGEFSVVAHLKQHSVTVSVGDFVNSGDFLGECGNSGLSDLPHLHFHVQDSPNFLDIVGSHGFPVDFQNVYKDGTRHLRSSVERGDAVSPY